jgi:co-chaperonin GroES (HSP10)
VANIGENGLDRKEAMDAAAQLAAEGFRCYGEKVGVIRDKEADKVGSIYIPDNSRSKPLRGTVVMVGEGVPEDFGISVGDRATFSKYNNVLFDLPLVKSGDSIYVEIVHCTDIYIGWRH